MQVSSLADKLSKIIRGLTVTPTNMGVGVGYVSTLISA